MDALNIIVLVLYILIIIGITVYSKNKSRTSDEFILAGRNVGGWMSAFAYGTTYFSAVIFIGYAGKFGTNWGLAAIWIGIGNAVIGSYVAWKFFANRTRNITNTLNVNTMPSYFEKRFDNKYLKIVSAIIIFVFLLPYSASVYQGLGHVFKIVFNVEFYWCVIAMAALTALYVFFGGYTATVKSNFVQALIMILGVIIMVVIFMTQSETGFSGLKELSAEGMGLFPQGDGAGIVSAKWFNLVIVVLLTSCGVLSLPQTIHKFYAVKSQSAVKKAIVICTVFSLIVGGGAYFIGSLATRFSFTEGLKPDMVVPEMLSRIMPAGLLGLIAVLLLSASMSTLSSLSITGASSVAVDIYKGYIKKDEQDKNVNLLMKSLSLVYIAISAVLAIMEIDAIVIMMGLSWGTLAGCFIGPYIYGLYSKKITAAAVMTSLISGVAVTFILIGVFGSIAPDTNYSGLVAIIKGGIKESPLIGVIAMAVSMLVTPIVSIFTKKPDSEKLDKMFDGIDGK
ncbi:MAG: sodium:solute symporter family protein [Clostridia bacterium]|nr:sodium:solute symporter family protein [Clostridia bacterium]